MPESMSYIARKSCGCIAAAVVDDPADKEFVARKIAEWVRQGFAVERVYSPYVNEHWGTCPHEPHQKTLFNLHGLSEGPSP